MAHPLDAFAKKHGVPFAFAVGVSNGYENIEGRNCQFDLQEFSAYSWCPIEKGSKRDYAAGFRVGKLIEKNLRRRDGV